MKIKLHPKFNVFTGLNGAGKTTILDAMFYLATGKSYFSYQDKYLFRYDTDFFRLEAELHSEQEKVIVEIQSSLQKKKSILCDEKVMSSIVDYFGRFPAFMIAPKDISILIESSIERRKLIDRTLSQVSKSYFVNLLHYNKLLKQRNAALKSFQKSKQTDHLLLDVLDQKMEAPATMIFQSRLEYVEQIAPIFSDYYNFISNEQERLSLSYESSLNDNSFLALRKNSRQKDVVLGKTTEGIHRDDVIILMHGNEIKKYASQGQLKSAIIALKLSQIEWVKQKTEKVPLLFLDDIFDKLDKERVNKLIDLCYHKMESQICVSDTDAERVSETLGALDIEFKHYLINDGKVKFER